MRLSIFCLLALGGLVSAFSGEGTAYSGPGEMDKTGFNACQYRDLEPRWQRMYGAMNHAQFQGSCGKCVRVRGTESGASGKSFLVKIIDECPECKFGDIDFSTTALKAITGFSWDRKDISWEYDDCDGPSDASTSSSSSSSSSSNSDQPSPDGNEKPKGTFTDWVVKCSEGRLQCPNLVLASMGYQCQNLDESKCCLQPDGKDCVDVDSEKEDRDLQWDGPQPNARSRRSALRKMLAH